MLLQLKGLPCMECTFASQAGCFDLCLLSMHRHTVPSVLQNPASSTSLNLRHAAALERPALLRCTFAISSWLSEHACCPCTDKQSLLFYRSLQQAQASIIGLLLQWKGLPYAECTFETPDVIAQAGGQEALDAYEVTVHL